MWERGQEVYEESDCGQDEEGEGNALKAHAGRPRGAHYLIGRLGRRQERD